VSEVCHPVRLLGALDAEAELRRPDPGHPAEAALAAGLAAAEADARAEVAALLPDVDLAALALRGDDGEVLHRRPGPDRVGAVVGDVVLDHVLGFHDQAPPRLRPMRDGQDLPYGDFAAPAGSRPGRTTRAQVGRLVAELTGGATVSIDGLDEVDAGLERFAERLERLFAARALLNGYVSGGDTSATRRHWDDHDVLVLQVEGAKHWEIRRPSEPAPLRGVVEDLDAGGEVAWSGTLEPGDALFVPRGHPHVVTPTGGFSFHVTSGLTRVRPVDVVRWLSARSTTAAALRRDLHPLAPDGDDAAIERAVAEELVAGSMTRYRRLSAALQPARATTRFSAVRQLLFTEDRAGLSARLALPGGLLVESTGPDEWVLAGAGRRWAVAPHALALVGELLAARPLAVEDLVVDCPSGTSCARTLVAQLAVDGVLAIDRAPGAVPGPSVG
jgi:hypothetical protein